MYNFSFKLGKTKLKLPGIDYKNNDEDSLLQDFREYPKLIYSKLNKSNNPTLSDSSKELRTIISKGKIHYIPHGFIQIINEALTKFFSSDIKKYKIFINNKRKITSRLIDEFHQLSWLLWNLTQFKNDDISISLDDIEEIYWTDNPDFVIKLSNNRIIYLEVTQISQNASHKDIRRIVNHHTSVNKIETSCNKNIANLIDDSINVKFYLVFFSIKNFDDHKIYYLKQSNPKLLENLEKQVKTHFNSKKKKINSEVSDNWNILYRIF